MTDVAAAVQAFYEHYPYPRPIDSLDDYQRQWRDPLRRRADYHLFWPFDPYREDRSILIAGCGTSQAAKHAVRWPDAPVTGIDVSATSIRSTVALKHKYDLENLEIRQLPLERVGELGTRFDLIVCTGVLHHLPDPEAGLRALRSVLAPGGALHLMVYAPYGRAGIYMLQEFCKRLDVTATTAGIRELVAALGALPPGHPLATLLRDAPDFRSEAALADALLHPQDRAYSVPQLFELLANAGFAFGRWIRQAPYACCGVMAHIPQASALARLPIAEQSAAIELFRGTMVRHSVVAYGDARDPIDFSDDYVPIRTADAICVRERLPPGAAGVLINRAHSYTDLYLPVDAAELRLVEMIDGHRTLGEIGNRRLFEQLWWHDQVVFDASG